MIKIHLINGRLNGAGRTISAKSDFARVSFDYLRRGRFCFRRCFCLSICLSVSNFPQKLPNGLAWNLQGRLAMGRRTND